MAKWSIRMKKVLLFFGWFYYNTDHPILEDPDEKHRRRMKNLILRRCFLTNDGITCRMAFEMEKYTTFALIFCKNYRCFMCACK
jgi:hypothetical protein